MLMVFTRKYEVFMGYVSFREGNFILCFRRGPETKVCPKRPIAKVWLVKKLHTVDEKNRAPPGMYKTL